MALAAALLLVRCSARNAAGRGLQAAATLASQVSTAGPLLHPSSPNQQQQQQQQQQKGLASSVNQRSQQQWPKPEYTVCKATGSLSFQVIPVMWALKQEKKYAVIERQGSLLLRFTPVATVEQEPAARTYDAQRAVLVSLSATELGVLLSLAAGSEHEFYHDPFKGKEGGGTVSKRLKIGKATALDGGRLFSVLMDDKKSKTSTKVQVPLTGGELAVLHALARSVLPTLLGVSQALSRPPVIAAQH